MQTLQQPYRVWRLIAIRSQTGLFRQCHCRRCTFWWTKYHQCFTTQRNCSVKAQLINKHQRHTSTYQNQCSPASRKGRSTLSYTSNYPIQHEWQYVICAVLNVVLAANNHQAIWRPHHTIAVINYPRTNQFSRLISDDIQRYSQTVP